MNGSFSAVLILVATIGRVDGGSARIDAGLIEGLRVGDLGTVYYELTVGAETRRVDLSSARVVMVDETGADLEFQGSRAVQAGHLVRFELPRERALESGQVRSQPAGGRLRRVRQGPSGSLLGGRSGSPRAPLPGPRDLEPGSGVPLCTG